MASKICGCCQKVGNLVCSRCKSVCYCSATCQRTEWNKHKVTCIPIEPLVQPSEVGKKSIGPCFTCKKPGNVLCGKCKKVIYCSDICQKSDWMNHKKLCNPCLSTEDLLKVGQETYTFYSTTVPNVDQTSPITIANLISKTDPVKALQFLKENKEQISLLPPIELSKSYVSKANIYTKLGNLKKAEDALKKAIQLNPNSISALFNLSIFYKNSDKIDIAINLLEKVIEIDPEYVLGLHNLAVIYNTTDKLELAIGLLKRVIKLEPDNIIAKYHLAMFYKKNKQLKLALNMINKVLSIEPDNVSYLICYFELLEEMI